MTSKTICTVALGMVIVAAVAVAGLGSSAVLAQGGPTPTRSLSELLGGQSAATPAPSETPAGSETPDTSLDLLWLQLDLGFSPVFVNNVVVGGPVHTYDAVGGDPCIANAYAAQLPTFELHLKSRTEYIRIGFKADDGSATSLVLWDPIEEQWWCNTVIRYGAELVFEPLVSGDYPIYVGVEGGGRTVTGQLYITTEPAE